MAQEYAAYYQGLSASYTDAIRASDFKANIVIFFLSIVIGPVIGARDRLPEFLPLPVALSPFLVAFLCLFVALLPRYQAGAGQFSSIAHGVPGRLPVRRRARP
jgi:hypothetical protein